MRAPASSCGLGEVSTVRVRTVDERLEGQLKAEGLEPWVASFLARRLEGPVDVALLRESTLARLPDPEEGIPGMRLAVERILRALAERETIVCACDHDVDGTASAAVFARSFLEVFAHPRDRFHLVTSHRIREGYGLTEPVVDRILGLGATLVITADKGSSDEPRIRRLKDAGVDVIVTDHHGLGPEGPPPSALACLNPCRPDARYDRTICGAAMAFVTMVKVARADTPRDHGNTPGLLELIDYVAVATIADCVSLRPDRGMNNRAFVRRGLARINRGTRPCWRVLLKNQRGIPLDEESVAFRLAPPINAAGRLDWSDLAIRFFLANDDEEAERHWRELVRENDARRQVDRRLTEKAFGALATTSSPDGAHGHVVFFDEDGHVGVQGIVASRLTEATGRPTVVLSRMGAGARDDPNQAADSHGLLTGSVRGVPGFHVRHALQTIADRDPRLLVSFGGHEGAGGLKIRERDLARFRQAFMEAVARAFPDGIRPVFEVDDLLDARDIPRDLGRYLDVLAPFGKDFPPPLFCGRIEILAVHPLGSAGDFRLTVRGADSPMRALWFARDRRDTTQLPCVGDTPRVVYRIRRCLETATPDVAGIELQILHLVADPSAEPGKVESPL